MRPKGVKTDTLEVAIKNRRSIRQFIKKEITKALVDKVIDAGRWAPSGLNNQPWAFKVLDGEKKDSLSRYTKYSRIITGANKLLLVFLDKKYSYNYEKDLMAIGACIENMLLYAYSKQIGTCWLGEILNKKKSIQKILKIPANFELTAVIALGYYSKLAKLPQRRKINELILK